MLGDRQGPNFPTAPPKALPGDRRSVTDARRVFADALVWDNTLPWGPGYSDHDETLPRFRSAGVDVVSLTVMGREGGLPETIRQLASIRVHIRERADRMVLCRSVDDIVAAKNDGKLGLILNLQDTMPFDGSTDLIQTYYDLGVRHAVLAYNSKNLVGDGCAERTDCGLSRYGITVIEEMNRVGMLVDGTHSGHRTTMEAMEVSSAPFIFSHSNAYAVHPHYRNIKDDQIVACAATGGVVGINGLGEFLDDQNATTASIFRHVDHIATLVGPRHVGIGLDYVKDQRRFWSWVEDNGHMWPQPTNGVRTHSEFAKPEQLLELTEMMLVHGYPESDVVGILGQNFYRTYSQAWK